MQEEPLVIEHREALVYLLSEGSELEHGIMCEYLFAAFSLKQTVEEGLTAEQLVAVDRWRKELFAIAGQEMLHFALVTNVLTALGYAPHVSRPNLPAPIRHYPAVVQLRLVPFGEEALEHFLYLERPEGMELEDAPGFVPEVETVPLMGADEIVPGRQGFATIGHLYRSLEVGLARLCEKYGEERIFVGPARAQATPESFHWPQLVAVTDLASAQAAIEVIVEQGEGARGDWEHSHYGRFVAMCDEYRALKAADPDFEPARPCMPTFVRPPFDVEAEILCTEPITAGVADIFNVSYEVMLQMIARFFGHGHETAEQAQVLADVAVAMMRTVLKPLGQLLTRMPACPDRPEITAGPAFELFYSSDYLLPHHQAAWQLFGDRLADVADFADRLAQNPAAPPEIGPVRDAVARLAATLAEHLPGAPSPAPAVVAVAAPAPRPHLQPVTGRDELAALLSAAVEIEHGLMGGALFAAASLKNDVAEGELTEALAERTRRWKRGLLAEGARRLDHVGQLAILLSAIGGTPRLARPVLPDPGPAAFSAQTAGNLAVWTDPDSVPLPPAQAATLGCVTAGDLYYRIGTGFRAIPEQQLIIGVPDAGPPPRFADPYARLVAVVDRASALAALDEIAVRAPAPDAVNLTEIAADRSAAVAEATGNGGFEPVRPVAANPVMRNAANGSTLIADGRTREVGQLCAAAYDTMLVLLTRSFAATADSDSDVEDSARIARRLLDSVVRPLGEALARLPVDRVGAPGLVAGPLFGSGMHLPLPIRRAAANALVAERLADLARNATVLSLRLEAPAELIEATAALQDLAVQAAPVDGPAGASAVLAGFRQVQAGLGTGIQSAVNGPYLVTNADNLCTWLGEAVAVRPRMALCRCGESAMKPFCDGAHARTNFTGAKDPKRIADRRDTHVGEQVTVYDNRGICAHSGFCTDRLATVFHAGTEPFVTADGAPREDVIRAVRACPSGALSYALDGVEQRTDVDPARSPTIEVSKDGPYRVSGGIALYDGTGAAEPRAAGSSPEHYSLCRCGHSQNKPFCSGMHWYVEFHHPERDASQPPTMFEWAGGLPALTRMTRVFYDKYVPADPQLGPLFAQRSSDHPELVAAWLAEVFGGPAEYTDLHGGYQHMLSQHLARALTEEQRARWVSLLLAAADDAGLPSDAEFRSAFVGYLEWGSRLAVENSQSDAKPAENVPVPHWDWGTAGPPGGRISALAPAIEETEAPIVLPAVGEPVSFAKHIKTLFRARDQASMTFALDLWAYPDVTTHAADILTRLRDGSMPCDGAWPAERIDVFARWMDSGMPA